jgi:hypothetical protein
MSKKMPIELPTSSAAKHEFASGRLVSDTACVSLSLTSVTFYAEICRPDLFDIKRSV